MVLNQINFFLNFSNGFFSCNESFIQSIIVIVSFPRFSYNSTCRISMVIVLVLKIFTSLRIQTRWMCQRSTQRRHTYRSLTWNHILKYTSYAIERLTLSAISISVRTIFLVVILFLFTFLCFWINCVNYFSSFSIHICVINRALHFLNTIHEKWQSAWWITRAV